MADPKKQKTPPGSDEDDEEDRGEGQQQGEAKVETQPVSTSSASNEPASSAKKGQKRKESETAAGVDLSAMYEATPGVSKKRLTMKELQAEKRRFKKSKIRNPSKSKWKANGREG